MANRTRVSPLFGTNMGYHPASMASNLPQGVLDILGGVTGTHPTMPPTVLYCEGWMLRLLLNTAAHGIRCLPFEFAPGARWFSEGSLYTAFGASTRSDRRAEKHTRADGVVGHFELRTGTKTGVVLRSDATQFVVLEAKIGSRLSAGTTNAGAFDQAARNVACVAQTVAMAGMAVNQVELGFYLIAPQAAIEATLFDNTLAKTAILARISERIDQYEQSRRLRLLEWNRQWVEPVVDQLKIGTWAWEDGLDLIRVADSGLWAELEEFYRNTLRFCGFKLRNAEV